MKSNPFLQIEDDIKVTKVTNVEDTASEGPNNCVAGKEIWDPVTKTCILDPAIAIAEKYKQDDFTKKVDLTDKDLASDKLSEETITNVLDDGTQDDAKQTINEEQGYYSKLLFDSENIQNIMQNYPTYMKGQLEYTYNVLGENEHLTTAVPANEIEKYDIKVVEVIFKDLLPKGTTTDSVRDELDTIINSISPGGELSGAAFHKLMRENFINENPLLESYIKKHNLDEAYYENFNQLARLQCAIKMNARYQSSDSGRKVKPLGADIPSGPGSVGEMCGLYGAEKMKNVDIYFAMLSHYKSNGNLSKYGGLTEDVNGLSEGDEGYIETFDSNLTQFPGTKLSDEHYEYMKELSDPKHPKYGFDKKESSVQVVYNALMENDLERLRTNLLIGPDGKPIYKSQEEKIMLDEFLLSINPKYFNRSTWAYAEQFSATLLKETVINDKRGTLSAESWKGFSVKEKLDHLTVYKESLIKEINASEYKDVEIILDYFGLKKDAEAIEEFQKYRQEKTNLVEGLFDLEERHFPRKNSLGETVYPTDPQDFDRGVKVGIGESFFEVAGFQEYLKKIINEETRKCLKKGNSTLTECQAGVRQSVMGSNKDPYWKEYIGDLVGDDEEKRAEHWNAYLDWTNNDNLQDFMLDSQLFQQHLTNAVVTIQKNMTDQYGSEMEQSSFINILATIGVPEVIADEITSGMDDINYYLQNSKWGDDNVGAHYALGLDGEIRFVNKNPFDRDEKNNPLTGTNGTPQQVGSRWCITPLQRLDGYYVDDNNDLQKMDLSNAKIGLGKDGNVVFENYKYGQIDKGNLTEVVKLKVETFIKGRVVLLSKKQDSLYGKYTKNATFDDNGNLTKGKQLTKGEMQDWQEEFGEKFQLFNNIQETLDHIKVLDGEIVFMVDGKPQQLSESSLEYYIGMETRYKELKAELVTGSVSGVGSLGIIQDSAMLRLQRIITSMKNLSGDQEHLRNQISSTDKTLKLLGDFNLNFSSWDKMTANMAMVFGSVITPLGYGEYARKLQKDFQKNYPQAYKSEWGSTSAWIQSMLVESSGSVSLFAVAAGLSMVPGGQYLGASIFFASGAGGTYNDLTTAKIDAQAKIKGINDILDASNDISDSDRLALLREIEAAESAANQSESSIMFAGFCAGTVEMLFERYVTLPILKGPFKAGGKFASKWNSKSTWQKVLSISEYQVKTKTAELVSENLTTMATNIINIIQTGNGSIWDGILDDDGIDFDAQMQLLTTTLLISGASDIKTFSNIVSAEMSSSKDKKNRLDTMDRLKEVTAQLKTMTMSKINAVGKPTYTATELAEKIKEREALQYKMVVHTEQSMNRLKYLNREQLLELDGYAQKKRLLNTQLFEDGRTKDPKNPSVIKAKNEMVKKVADLQVKINGLIDDALQSAKPNIEGGTKNEYEVRDEASYLHGLYLSSNSRTQKTIEENGGLYFEINEDSYTYDDKGFPLGFNNKTKDKLLDHYKEVFNGDIAKATETVNDLFSASMSGKFAANIGKDAIMFTTTALRAIFNTPTTSGKTVYTLQQAQDAAVSGLHEVFHVNHAQTELNVKVGEKADGSPIYEKMTVSDIVNTEKGKQHADMVINEMDAMMDKEFNIEGDETAQAILAHYKARRKSYKENNNEFEVEEVLNIIGDLIAVGNFAGVKDKFKTSSVLKLSSLSFDTAFGQSLKTLINGMTSRLLGKDLFNLGQFDNAEQVFNYINRFYKANQGNKDFSLIQRAAGDDLDPTTLKSSMGAYESSKAGLIAKKTAIANQYAELRKGKSVKEQAALMKEFNEKTKGLTKQIDKINKNIETSNANAETIKVIKRAQIEYDRREQELLSDKAMLEEHGDPDGRLKKIKEELANMPMSDSHRRAKDALVKNNEGIIFDFIKAKYDPTVSGGATRSDFESATMEYVAKIINRFKPNELVTDVNGKKPGPPADAGYIPTNPDFGYYLRDRLIVQQSLGNILKLAKVNLDISVNTVSYDADTTYTDDIEDTEGFNPDDITVGGGANVEVKSSDLRKTIPTIDDKAKAKIIKTAAVIIKEEGIKGDKKKTRQKVQDAFAKAYKELVIKGVGTLYLKDPLKPTQNLKDENGNPVINPKFEKYLKDNKKLIISMLAIKYKNKFKEFSFLIKKRASVEETNNLQANPDYNGFIESTTAGNSIWGMVQFDDPNADGYMTEQEFLDVFYDLGSDNRNGKTRYDRLMSSIAAELGLDASFDAIKENDPTNIDNYFSYYAEIGKRDPKIKFSNSGVDLRFPVDYNWNNFNSRMSQLFAALKGRDHVDSIILDVEDPNYMTIKGFEDTFLPVEVSAAYHIIRDIGPDMLDESSVRLRSSILANENTPQWLVDKLTAVDWSSSKEMKDRKAKQVASFYENHIGKEIAEYLGYDLGGFHNSVMDSAENKKLKNGDGLVVVKEIPISKVDGKELKNESFYGKIPTKEELSNMTDEEIDALEFGVWDVVGWEYMPGENAFRNADGVFSVDPVGQHNADIRSGEYYKDLELTKSATQNSTSNTKVKLEDVRLMNKSQKLFKSIDAILVQDISRAEKLILLEVLAPEIAAASKANRGLAAEIVGNMINSVADGDMDADVFISILQSQTNLVKGLRALSGLDFVTVTDGAQNSRTYGEHMDPNVRLMIKLQGVMMDVIEFDDAGNAIGFKDGADPASALEAVFADHTQFYTNAEVSLSMDKPTRFNEKLVRGLKPLLSLGSTITKKDGEEALLDLADKLEDLDNEYADEIASHLNIAIEAMQDGYAAKATQALKRFNKACKDIKDGKGLNLSTSDLALERFKLLSKEDQANVFSFSGETLLEKVKSLELAKIVKVNTAAITKKNEDARVKENDNTVKRAIKTEKLLNGEGQGASIFDFDGTLEEGGKNIIIATHVVTGETINILSHDFHKFVADPKNKNFGYNFDDFINVKESKKGPMFQKFLNQIDKYGTDNIHILTARQPGAALAIQMWLKQNGVNLPLENITGLGVLGPDGNPIVVSGKDKASWIEQNLILNGFNDIYFVDDGQAIVNDVKDMMLRYPSNMMIDGGKSVLVDPDYADTHAKYSGSSNSAVFNDFIEETSGVDASKVFSAAQARLRGSKVSGIDNIIPYSAEDFKGLLYQFLADGDQGEYQFKWFSEKLIKPYSRGEIAISAEKQLVTGQFKKLLRDIPKISKKLKTTIGREDGTDSNYTLDHAVRVYLWSEVMGIDMEKHGLSKRDQKLLVDIIKNDEEMIAFATQLSAISNQADGYIKPGKYWTIENISSDINDVINVVGREKHLAEFLENKNQVFSEENLNKIESIHGTKYREALELMLDRMETGSSQGKKMKSGDRVTDMYNNWVNNSVGAVMFLNGRSAVLQTLSTFNYVKLTGPNNPAAAASAFANQPQFWADFTELWNSDYLVSRRTGQQRGINEAELYAAIEKADNKPKAAIAWLLSKGFLPTQIADSFAICSGGSTYVRNYTNTVSDMLLDYKASGVDISLLFEAQDIFTEEDLKIHLKGRDINTLTEQELGELAKNIATEKFVLETESGQQSSRQDMLSQQQTGGLGRLVLAFKNTPMQYTRKILRASQDLKNGRGNPAEHIGKIAYYGGIQNLMFTGLQQTLFASLGADDEEWEEKTDNVVQSMVDNILNGMGLGGVIVVTVKNGVLEYQQQEKKGWNADHTYTILQFANFSPTIGSKLRKLYGAIKGKQYNEGAIEKMDLWNPQNPAWASVANLVSALTNLPADRLVNKMNNLFAISADENEWWQNLSLLLGWNTWDLGVETEAKLINKKFKEEKIIEKKEEKKEEAQKVVDVVVEEEVKKEEEGKGTDVNTCAGAGSGGERCKVKVDKAGDKCQYHASKKEKAKMKKCGHIYDKGPKKGKGCGNFAVNDAGRCNVAQHQPKK